MMALEMAVEAPRLMVLVVQEGEARDNLFPPPPASLRRLEFFFFTFRHFVYFGFGLIAYFLPSWFRPLAYCGPRGTMCLGRNGPEKCLSYGSNSET